WSTWRPRTNARSCGRSWPGCRPATPTWSWRTCRTCGGRRPPRTSPARGRMRTTGAGRPGSRSPRSDGMGPWQGRSTGSHGWGATPLAPRGTSGIWEGFVHGVGKGALYKFRIEDSRTGFRADKTDPFALFTEIPPKAAAVVWDLDHQWGDHVWMATRAGRNALD